MPSVEGSCPPLGVHLFVPMSGVGCPAVRCPAVRCPVIWLGRPGSGGPAGWCPPVRRPAGWCPPVRRPAGWCPPVRRPAGWCPPVCPVTSVSSAEARRWPWGSRRCGGQPSQRERIELQVVLGVRAAWSTARVGLEGGDAVEVVRRRAGSVGRGAGRVVLGRRLRPRSTADRPGVSPA
jgi:hypothetical protein